MSTTDFILPIPLYFSFHSLILKCNDNLVALLKVVMPKSLGGIDLIQAAGVMDKRTYIPIQVDLTKMIFLVFISRVTLAIDFRSVTYS